MTPWRVVLLGAVAVALVVVALLDAASHPGPCATANSSAEKGLVAQAEHTYRAILAGEPTNRCGLTGMAKVALALCNRGNELVAEHAPREAMRVYDTLLEVEPETVSWHRCGVAGLRSASAADPAALCPQSATKPCLVNVVQVTAKNGANGKNGVNGVNGKDGVNGVNGKNGVNGTNGKNGVNGINGKNGVNGVNGTNGATGTAGRNGLNGQNGKNGLNGANGKNGASGPAGHNGANGRNGLNSVDSDDHTASTRHGDGDGDGDDRWDRR